MLAALESGFYYCSSRTEGRRSDRLFLSGTRKRSSTSLDFVRRPSLHFFGRRSPSFVCYSWLKWQQQHPPTPSTLYESIRGNFAIFARGLWLLPDLHRNKPNTAQMYYFATFAHIAHNWQASGGGR
jgi:hypothetical protein